MERRIVEHTSPLWRLTAAILFFVGLFFGGWFAKILQLEEQFSTFFVLTALFAATFWAKKRPDKLQRRFGAFGRIAIAAQESADDIRASMYRLSLAYGLLFGGLYALFVIIAKELIYAVVISIYAWQMLAAAGCLVAAVVVAPQFFSAAVKRMSVPDEGYPEESREVESRFSSDGREIERGDVVSERPENGEERTDMDQTNRNAEAKFASPDGSSEGIGYYFEGEPVSSAEFERLVAEKAERLRDEGND